MAFFMGTIYSKSMLQDTSFNVILPHDGRRYIWNEPPKTLILLHGLSDSAATWIRRTAIERYAERYNLAVIIPEVQRSWYQDMVYGVRAFHYITEEVLDIASKMFHISTKREDVLIAGLSMGGYGALRCALEKPEKFGCCGAFSGAYDLKDMYRMGTGPDGDSVLEGLADDYGAIFVEKKEVPEEVEIPEIISKVKNKSVQPRVYMMCGTEDFLYKQTCKVRELCEQSLSDFTYEEWPGHHEWDMWDEAIERMLKLFLGEGRIDFQD